MEYRHGTCRDCDAEYKVPATFEGDKAKCKKCGGTVTLGPASAPRAAAQPVPAKKPARPKPPADELVEHQPSGRQGAGPSMKERLKAAREEGAHEAPKPAAAAPGRAARPAPSTRRSAAAGAAAGGVRRGAGATSRSAARRAGGRRGKAGQDEDDGDEEGAGRRGRTPAKKSPLPMIAVGVGVLLIAGATWQFGFNGVDPDEVNAGNGDEAVAGANDNAPVTDVTSGSEDDAPAADGGDDDSGDDDGGAASDGGADAFADLPDLSAAGIRRYTNSGRQITTPRKLLVSIPEELSGVLQNQVAQANSQQIIKVVKRKADFVIASGTITGADGVAMEVEENRVLDKLDELYWARDIADELYVIDDPAEPQLHEFERFGPPEGVSDDEWASLQEDVRTMLDPDAGAAGGRAQRALEEAGRKAVPAIINAMLDLNLATDGGYMNGGVCYKALRNICNNQGFAWDYRFDDSPKKCTLENRRTVEKYHQVWEKVIGNPEYWWQFTKLDKDESADQPAAADDDDAAGIGSELDGLDDLDDL
jgi:hypothetical protein